MLPVQECSKRAKNSPIFSKNAKFTLTLMSKEKLIFFLLQIQILHFKNIWNLPSLSLAQFFLIQNALRTMCAQKILLKMLLWSLVKTTFQTSRRTNSAIFSVMFWIRIVMKSYARVFIDYDFFCNFASFVLFIGLAGD